MKWANGGNVFDGIRHDNGKYTWSNGTIYEGDWVDGKMAGKGLIIFPSGNKYEGEFSGNWYHGKGTHTWKDGRIYIGDWEKNKMNGRGIMKWANGDVFDGCWSNGLRHGNGKFMWSNGRIYEGDWVDGKMTGKGMIISSSSGNKYEGEFFGNFRHGNGTQTWTDGSIYIGNWTEDKMDGKGSMKWANGAAYDGCWSNGHRHGFGVCRFANGGIYVGTWSKGLEDGKGTFYYPYEKVSGRSKSSHHSSHKISILDENFRDSASTLLQTADEGRSDASSMSYKVVEMEYVLGVLIRKRTLQYLEITHDKNKRQDKFSAKQVKKSSGIRTFLKTIKSIF
ncbi:phosphatidylinositol-4-phosphate 5-kinase [Trifolium pratense]|uniref:Phosphatidylinositol-4-phosphate 5-kinase n=1 Tax=Trifolium pratense TaxID=57577 RepID=A0A2K3NM95_TRIPR|nr:phosphatidylinositol-4-phosphate 5-kinase [Trifolium pratense]